jgi:hypothetical protein
MSHVSKTDDDMACHLVREALLLGLCMLRFGAFETRLYDLIMARLERRERAVIAHNSATRSGV